MININRYIFGKNDSSSGLLTDLITFWKFNSNSNDSTSNGHNGTDTSIDYSNPGIIGNCATFNGVNSKIIVPYNSDFDFSTISSDKPFSYNAWVKFNGTSDYSIINRYDGSSNSTFELQTYSTKILMLLFSNASSYIGAQTTASFSTGSFFMLTITYDGSGVWSGIKIYFNGVLQTVTSFNSGTYTKMPLSALNISLGRYLSGGGFFNGSISQSGIWARELTTLDIAELNNSGAGITYPF